MTDATVMSGVAAAPAEPVVPGVAGPKRLGWLLAVVFFGGFALWSATMPLERAALSGGSLVVEGSRRQVQHLEGGIVRKILVREGSLVEAGQPLLQLDPTIARTQFDQLRAQIIATEAQIARLRAEAEELGTFVAPDLTESEAVDPRIATEIGTQRRIFDLRRRALTDQRELLGQRNRQSREEIGGLRAEITGQDRQLELIDREIATVRGLLERGLEREPRLLALERNRAEIVGARGQNVARIARSEQAIVENEMRALDLSVQTASEAAQKLRDEEVRLSDLRDRLRAVVDVLDRLTITSPVTGKVVNLKVFTERGVINPRETLMEVVPRDDRLVVDAQILPADADVVRIGATARIRFTSLPQRSTPVLNGAVEEMAADRQVDPRTGATYYTARIALGAGEIERLGTALYPGQPVEVTVNAGEHTLIDYLFQPLAAWRFRAMKER